MNDIEALRGHQGIRGLSEGRRTRETFDPAAARVQGPRVRETAK